MCGHVSSRCDKDSCHLRHLPWRCGHSAWKAQHQKLNRVGQNSTRLQWLFWTKVPHHNAEGVTLVFNGLETEEVGSWRPAGATPHHRGAPPSSPGGERLLQRADLQIGLVHCKAVWLLECLLPLVSKGILPMTLMLPYWRNLYSFLHPAGPQKAEDAIIIPLHHLKGLNIIYFLQLTALGLD